MKTFKTTNTSNAQAVPYRRYSSKKQAEGSSELRQEAGFDHFLASSKLPRSPQEYWDKAKSGYHGKHLEGDFGRLLADCAEGKFPAGSVIWFEDMDRFGRMKQREVQNQWGTITEAGYGIHIASENKTFWEHTGEMERLGTILKAILAHEHSDKLSGRVKVARQKLRDTGKTKAGKVPNTCPRWLKVAEDGKGEKNAQGAYTGYAKNQPFWDTLKAACLMSINGNGASIIGARLGLSPNGLVATFRERTLIGEFQHHYRDEARSNAGVAIEGFYPPLLSVDEFRQLQAALDSRRQKGGSGKRSNPVTNLFTGLVFNSDGCEMVIKAQRRNALKPYGVPADWKRTEGEKGNGKRWLPGKELHYDVFESAVLDVFAGLSAEQLYPKDTNEEAKQLRELSARIQDLDSKREGWEIEALESGSPALSRMIVAAEAKVNALKAEYEAIETKLSANKADTLPATQSLITELMEKKTGQELLDMRAKLKGMLSLSIARITVEVHGTKSAGITVQLRNGSEVRTGEFTKVGKLTVALREIA